MNTNTKRALIISSILILLGLSAFYLYKKFSPKIPIVEQPVNEVINNVTFNCASSKNIQAIFYKDKVDITLSDGRNMILPQVISASGARYSNADDSFIFWNKGDGAFIEEGGKATFVECLIAGTSKNISPVAKMANPASLNCIKLGGNLVMNKSGNGGEYGLCYFEDNMACEEWALFRGECPIGGVKTTGFNTIDQKYCAWAGGKTTAVSKSICTFKDGSKCFTIDFYNGKCPVSK